MFFIFITTFKLFHFLWFENIKRKELWVQSLLMNRHCIVLSPFNFILTYHKFRRWNRNTKLWSIFIGTIEHIHNQKSTCIKYQWKTIFQRNHLLSKLQILFFCSIWTKPTLSVRYQTLVFSTTLKSKIVNWCYNEPRPSKFPTGIAKSGNAVRRYANVCST